MDSLLFYPAQESFVNGQLALFGRSGNFALGVSQKVGSEGQRGSKFQEFAALMVWK